MTSFKPGMVYEISGQKKKSVAADFASSNKPLKFFRLRSILVTKFNPTWLASPATTAKFFWGDIGKVFLARATAFPYDCLVLYGLILGRGVEEAQGGEVSVVLEFSCLAFFSAWHFLCHSLALILYSSFSNSDILSRWAFLHCSTHLLSEFL